jgi:hypothetical protein
MRRSWSTVLATPAAAHAVATAFVESFIRPATPIVVQALEELAQTKPEPVAAIPRRIVALRLMLLLFALPELPDHVRRLTRRKRKAVRTAKARTVT